MKKRIASYYRKITERLPQGIKKWFKKNIKIKQIRLELLQYFILVLVLMLAVLIFTMGLLFLKYLDVKDQRERAVDNLIYWKGVIQAHPNFPDGYYNAGLYSIELGDNQNAESFLHHAVVLDPSFEKARELEKSIER